MKHEAKYIVSDIEIVVRNLQKEGYLRVTHNELMKRLPDPQRLTPNGAEPDTCPRCKGGKELVYPGDTIKKCWMCDGTGQV